MFLPALLNLLKLAFSNFEISSFETWLHSESHGEPKKKSQCPRHNPEQLYQYFWDLGISIFIYFI